MTTIEPGRYYTMSIRKGPFSDRSYCSTVWEVLALNETHVVIRSAAPRDEYSFGAKPQVVIIGDFDWTEADELRRHLQEREEGMIKFSLLNQQIRDQIGSEGPQLPADDYEKRIDEILERMSVKELLEMMEYTL